MKTRTLTLAIVVLAATFGATLPAQQSEGPIAVAGCLQRAGEQADQYVLVVSNEQRHQVQPAADVELAPHVNHQVELTGTVQQADGASVIRATAIKMIADSCKP